MAYINGNKPIVTDGLVYALDFGNTKSYTSGSNRARSLVFDTATTIVTGSSAIPALTAQGLDFTSNQWIQRSASLSALDPNGTFTICAVVKANTSGTLFTQNSSGGNLSGRFQSTSSLSTGFTLSTGDFSRIYSGNFTGSQHITYRYNSGSFDTFVNGIPVTASQANLALTGSGLTSTLFINSGSLPFSGSLSSFYVYNRALTADEIYQNFEIASTRYGLPFRAKPYTIDENLYQFLQTTGITDTVTTNALSTFISGLKSNGLWNKMVAIYPFVSNTTASLTTNLKEPGIYRLALTGSYSASALGLTPSSSTAFIDTIPSNTAYASVNSQSAHLTVLSYDLPTGNGFLAGNSLPAVGGDLIIQSGSKILHAFRTTGTSSFTMLNPSVSNVEVLVVAGGGAGGGNVGGGGGAGGVVYSSSFAITPNSPLQVIVGNGGTPNILNVGNDGQNSFFSTIVAFGGGGGGTNLSNGRNGGSGGGGAIYGTGTVGGTGVPGQGNAGGSGSFNNSGAGGGGASQTGSNSVANFFGGPGGSGSFYPQFSLVGGFPAGWFGGGGGGGGGESIAALGKGGPGGGGTGGSASPYTPTSGVDNTGGGGGGRYTFAAGTSGASGGSGIVIVSYDAPASALTGSGTGIYLTETSITGSVNSQFTSGITGSGNIGLLTVSRTQPAAFSIHKNNVSQSVASASLGALSTDIFLNTSNLAGSGSLPLQAGISFASIGSGLTTSEVATYHNLISQLQSNLRRQNTLLDNFSGAAAAYSLRRIGPSSYFGPAIRVRRDSDNALRDIGFTSDGQLDTVGLLDFVGVTGSGFVQTWYDQSGNNNNAVQTTSANQPLVITSGSVVVENRKPTLRFDGTNDRLEAPSTLLPRDLFTVFAIVNGVAGGFPSAGQILSKNTGATGRTNFIGTTDNSTVARIFFNDGTTTYNVRTTSPVFNLTQNLVTAQSDGLGNSQIGANGVIEGTLTGRSWTPQNVAATIGASTGGGNEFRGIIQELIAYESYQSSTRPSIESNINTNYKIYGSATASFDPDYQAFITATGITQTTQSAALETLVSDLKSYGLWNKMKAIYPMITDRNNRFAYSEELDNAQWNKVGSLVTPNASPSPLGTVTGELVAEDTSTGDHYIYQTLSNAGSGDLISGSEYVASVYGRFLNRPWIAIETNAGARAWFNIQTGITGSLTGSRSTISAVSGGWYRCALYFTSSVASGPQNIQYHLADTNNNLTYTGISGTGSYMWGAQFENGNVLGPYRSTTATGFTTGSMLDQMKFNLRNPVDTDNAFRIQYSGSWNGGYSGIITNRSNTWADTKLNPSSSLSPSNTHLGLYLRNETPGSTTGVDMGSTDLVNFTQILTRATNTGAGFRTFINIAESSSVDPYLNLPSTKGLIVGSRNTSTLTKWYKNNTTFNQVTSSLSIHPNFSIYIGARNQSGTPFLYAEAYQNYAFSTIGDGLTDYEAKALYWIVQKFQTTLGRQVY